MTISCQQIEGPKKGQLKGFNPIPKEDKRRSNFVIGHARTVFVTFVAQINFDHLKDSHPAGFLSAQNPKIN